MRRWTPCSPCSQAWANFRTDEYGRKNPGWWLARNRAFLAALDGERAHAVIGAKAKMEKDRRKAALMTAISNGFFKD